MSSIRPSTVPKPEFTEVITIADSPNPETTPEFTTVITENSLLDVNTPIPPMPHTDLIEYYDQMFPTLELYQNFMKGQIAPWAHNLDVRLFDSLYRHQRSTTDSIKRLRAHAQKLLEEANALQERKYSLRSEIDRHLSTITKPELRRRLYNPHKVYPKTPTTTTRRPLPTPSTSQRPVRSTRETRFALRCFQCDSPSHIKWNCPDYRCKLCGHAAPGHSQRDCLQPYDDGLRGHYDIEGERDGNLTGEC